MKGKIQKWIHALIALLLSLAFGAFLMIYASPMEDISLDLTIGAMMDAEVVDPEQFDSKG